MEPLSPGDPPWVGEHRVAGRLGEGGIGPVFLAHSQRRLPVAVTLARPQLAADPAFRSRFRQDVDVARSVRGAYVASIVDADTEAPLPWLAAVWLPGLTLHDTIGVYGPLPGAAVRTLGVGLAEALISIHRAGAVHGELSPSAIVLTHDGLRVTDLARTGGPSFYLAPERVTREETGPPGDVFSLGSCLAFASTGHGPFGEGPSHVLLYRIVHEEPRLDDVADAGLRDLLAACMAKEPADRPTPQQVMDGLAAAEMPDGLGWLPAEAASGIAALPTPLYGSAVPPRPPGPARAPDPELVEPRRPLGWPLEWRALAVGGVVAAMIAATALTHPGLWSDGEACAGIGEALSTRYDPGPRPPIEVGLTSGPSRYDVWSERRKRLLAREEAERKDRYKALADVADSDKLRLALNLLAADPRAKSGWADVEDICG